MYVNQWNLSIQRQLGQGWLVSANYLGNSTIHMITSESVNPAVYPGTGPCTLPEWRCLSGLLDRGQSGLPAGFFLWRITRKASIWTAALVNRTAAARHYEGLYLSANKRLSKNTSLLSITPGAHCISDVYRSADNCYRRNAQHSDRRQHAER